MDTIRREDVLGEIMKLASASEGKSTSAEISGGALEKARKYVESCVKCSFKMNFALDLLATNAVDRAATLDQAKEVVQELHTACDIVLRYSINLLNAPQKMEYRRIKLANPNYSFRVASKFSGPEKVFIHMGYRLATDTQEFIYEGAVNRDAVAETIVDLVILYAMLELHLKWLQNAKESIKLKDIIDFCKTGFSHSKILDVISKPSGKVGGHLQQQPIQQQNAFPLLPVTVVDPNGLPMPVHASGKILRQGSYPDDRSASLREEQHALTRSNSLEASIGSHSSETLNDQCDNLFYHGDTQQPSSTVGAVAITMVEPSTVIPFVHHVECSYCMFLNSRTGKQCEVCNNPL